MPIYEYVCRDCGHEFEELRLSSSGGKKTACPKCGGGKTSQRYSAFATRQSSAASSGSLPVGACGRCGDPNGPCRLGG